jgi:class 3 adenylate cyclase
VHPSDLAVLEAAGLYDPAAPDAAGRLALLEWLAARGTTVEQMIDSKRTSTLTGLAGDLALRDPGRLMTLAEVAAAAGMPPERIEQIRRAAGLPPAAPDEKLFSPDDAPGFAGFGQAAQLFGEEPTLQFIRVIGSALARVAEAAVSLFLVNIEGPIVAAGGSELALARANLDVMKALEIIPPVATSLLRAHVESAIRRMRSARADRSVDVVRLTVGFVDLVGFTTLSRQLSARELADVVLEFEGAAHDLIAARDGRLVKLIGDEVMFVTVDGAAACDVALTLVERFERNAAITPRGGLAAGPLLMRGGDYYGPVVNLAARIAELAVPREVLVTDTLAAQAGGGAIRFEPAGKRMLKGFDEPVTLYAAARPVLPSDPAPR